MAALAKRAYPGGVSIAPGEPLRDPNATEDASEAELLEDERPSSVHALPELSESVVLVQRARHGDEDALGNLLERYRDRLLRIIRIELGGLQRRFDPEDVLNEVFLVARRRVQDFEFRSHAGILAWLVTIAKRKAKDQARKERAGPRDAGRDVPLDPGTSVPGRQLAADTSGPTTRVWRNEIRELMDGTLAQLPEHYRRVILMRDYYGADLGEIARELGRTRRACEELHRRAWIRLKLEVMRRLRSVS